MPLTTEQRIQKIQAVREHAELQGIRVLLLGETPEDYADAIIGTVDLPFNAVVYLRSKILEELIRLNEGWSLEDAEEWYEFNILGSLGHYDSDTNWPIIVDDI